MVKYIGLTARTSHWGTCDNTLLLTDGCRVRGGEESWRYYEEPVDMARFHAAGAVIAAQELCNQYALAYMPILADALEAHLKLGYGQRFYQRIIAPWLVWFVQSAYDRYCSICKAASLPDVCFITAEGKLRPRSSASTHNDDIATDDSFNLLFYSDIVRGLKLPEKKIPVSDFIDSAYYQYGDFCSSKGVLKKTFVFFVLAFEKLFSSSTHLCYSVFGVPSLRDIMHYKKGLLPMFYNIQLNLKLDEHFRSKKLAGLCNDDFCRILNILIPRYLPMGLCEALPQFVQWAKQQDIPQKGVIATSVGLYCDPALLVLAGVRQRPLAIVEHGGNGMLCQSDPHLFTQRITGDRYYSMGQGNFSLPSPYLASQVARKNLSRPLLVANNGCRFLPRIMPTVCEGSMIPYHERRKAFFNSIAPNATPLVRLYFEDYGWGVQQDILRNFPYVEFQDGCQTSILQALADTCLLILDHYSTSMHRAMATNVPTIIFTPRSSFSAEAEEVIVLMKNVGIWHDTPEDAARFYGNLVGNNAGNWIEVEKAVRDWWMGRDVQAARSEFCDKFAAYSTDWSDKWVKAFDELAGEWA